MDHDHELIAAVAAGDDTALRELFARHAPWLAARLRALLPAADVEDVLQETFLAVWQGARSYRPDAAGAAWLWGIARRQAAQWLRRRGRAVELVAALAQAGAPGLPSSPIRPRPRSPALSWPKPSRRSALQGRRNAKSGGWSTCRTARSPRWLSDVDLDRVWTGVAAQVWQRRPGRAERTAGRLLRSPGLARAPLTTPSLLLPWLIASAAVLAAGAVATRGTGQPLVALLAPAVAAAGIAYAYGPGIDPAWELSRSMAAGAAAAGLAGGSVAMARNVAGLAGLGLLSSAVLGGLLAWIGPMAYAIVAEFAIIDAWTTPWMWPARPPHDWGAALCAALAFAAGLTVTTVRGARAAAHE